MISRLYPSQYAAKLGGVAIGKPTEPRLALVIPQLFNQCQRPAGLVYSAPSGLTKRLDIAAETLNEGGSAKRVQEDCDIILGELETMWDTTVKSIAMSKLHPRVSRRFAEFVETLEVERKSDIEELRFKTGDHIMDYFKQARNNSIPGLRELSHAGMLSMGERYFEAAVMKPLGKVLEQVFDIPVIFIDPISNISSEASKEGHVGIIPDIDKSIENVAVVLKTELAKKKGSSPVAFMPGYFFGKSDGAEVATMPFNGSDLSLYILAAALDTLTEDVVTGLVYVKHVEGGLEDTGSLLRVQNESRLEVGGKRELIMKEALELIIRDKRPLRVFDPRVNRVFNVTNE